MSPHGYAKNTSRGTRPSGRDKAHGKRHPEPAGNAKGSESSKGSTTIPIELQQLLLNVFKKAFSTRFDSDLPATIQNVKQQLFNRDFEKAFGSKAHLEAYATRWSPSRALAYLEILCSLPHLSNQLRGLSRGDAARSGEAERPSGALEEVPPDAHVEERATMPQPYIITPTGHSGRIKITCLGGGAGAEVVAFAGYLRYFYSSASDEGVATPSNQSSREDSDSRSRTLINFDIAAVDMADWSMIVRTLSTGVSSPAPISKYASVALKAMNAPLVDPNKFTVSFHRQDVLNMDMELMPSILQDTALVTLMFTLNELYTASMTGTTNFLLSLTYILEPGSLLLVVDSPGSYSTVGFGKTASTEDSSAAAKKYPMQWLLDHTLLEASTIGSSRNTTLGGQWEKLVSDESRWFRLPEGLTYPIELEDMRYQIHLYRRL
ncbi:hypothetical protein MMC08_001655 [Hypocenomyce scalaris]|nr:hypothetical protein [Hypocenomyce scalaris]